MKPTPVNAPLRMIWNALYWTHERATWQYDLMVVAILAFVWLTPPGWLGDPTASGSGPIGWLVQPSEVSTLAAKASFRAATRTMLDSHSLLRNVLMLLGAGFLAANVRIVVQFVRYLRLRSSAVLVWPGTRPPAYGLFLTMGGILGIVIIIKLIWLQRPPQDAFGEAMMLLYYGYLVPLSLRIGRGFYQDGVWMEDGFMPYAKIGGLSWREGAAGAELRKSRCC